MVSKGLLLFALNLVDKLLRLLQLVEAIDDALPQVSHFSVRLVNGFLRVCMLHLASLDLVVNVLFTKKIELVSYLGLVGHPDDVG